MTECKNKISTFFKDNRELFLFIGIFFLFYIAAAFFDFFEFFHKYFDRFEHQELDEIFAVSTILFFATFIFFLIRSSKLRKEIKARKQAEEELKKAAQKINLMLEYLPVALYFSRTDGDYGATYISENIKDICGYEPVEFISDSSFWVDRIHPGDKSKVLESLSVIMEKGYNEYEYLWQTKQGDYKWFYDCAKLIKSEEGGNDFIIGMWLDITGRKKTEELATQLGELVEGSLNEVYITDVETLKFIYVNERARNNLGYSTEEILNMGPLYIKSELDENTFHSMIAPLLSGEKDRLEQISTHRRKDGSTYPAETFLKISSFKGRKVFVASVHDISERERVHSLLLSEKNILEMISKQKGLNEILERICHDVEHQSSGMLCSFLLVDESGDSLFTYAAPNLPQDYLDKTKLIPIADGIGSCGTASFIKEQVIVHDIETDLLWSDYRELALSNNLQACWSTPILSNSGELLGTFAMYYSEPRSPVQREFDIIERATYLARIAIEHKKTDDSLKKNLDILSKKSRYEEIISTVTRSVHSSIDFQDVLDNAVESLSRNMKLAENVSIVMVEGDQAILASYRGLPKWFIKRLGRIPKPKGFVWKVIIDGEMRYCPDVDKDKYIGPAGRELGTKSYLSVPFKHKGVTIGCINLHSFKIDAFSQEDISLIEFVARQIEAAISNAKQAEALRESEERYRTLYDQSPLGIFTFDRDLKLTSSNKRLLEIMKSSSYGIQGLDLTKLKDQKFTYLYHEALSGNPAHLEDIYSTTRSEIDVWLSISAAPLTDADSVIIGGIAVVEDVTDRKIMEEKLIKSQKLESLGILAGGIAHDFNNLLSSIMTNLSLAKTNPNIDDELLQLFHESEEAAIRASELVSQLITFSKGGAPVKKPLTNFSELVRTVANYTVSGSRVTCVFDIEKNLWFFEADRAQISQVIQNLVMNAEQSMNESGVIKISLGNHFISKSDISLPVHGKYIRLTIEDSGKGIPDDDLQKIFDPYFTTKDMGHGLGLSSVYSIVKNHDGYIDVESEPGAGTKFHVYLPSNNNLPEKAPQAPKAVSGERGRILFMDDENLIKIATGRMLIKLGYEVDYASDGEEAVELYKRSLLKAPYDLVIMDLTVPGGMGGVEATKILKSLNPEVKVIVSSGYSKDPVMSDYKEYGFTDVVKKPYQLEALSSTIDSILNDRTH